MAGTAEQNEAVTQEIKSRSDNYFGAFADGRYTDAINLMADGMTVFGPYGVMQNVDARGRAALAQTYADAFAKGAQLSIGPMYHEVKSLSDSQAIGTFIGQGFGVAAESGTRFDVSRRYTQVWSKSAEGLWQIEHIHASNLETVGALGALLLA